MVLWDRAHPIAILLDRKMLFAPETGLYFLREQTLFWILFSNNYIMNNAYIFDIDWTLTRAKDYRQSSIKLVPVNEAVKEILLSLRAQWYDILIVSARSNKYRDQVFEWLSHNGIQINGMFLKEEWDKRHASDIKREIYEQQIMGKYDIRWVFEDDPKVMSMYTLYWIQCFEVI